MLQHWEPAFPGQPRATKVAQGAVNTTVLLVSLLCNESTDFCNTPSTSCRYIFTMYSIYKRNRSPPNDKLKKMSNLLDSRMSPQQLMSRSPTALQRSFYKILLSLQLQQLQVFFHQNVVVMIPRNPNPTEVQCINLKEKESLVLGTPLITLPGVTEYSRLQIRH